MPAWAHCTAQLAALRGVRGAAAGGARADEASRRTPHSRALFIAFVASSAHAHHV